jgi:hypothetical protein
MIWAILILLGVPLWLCILGISTLLMRNRKLRKRYGDIPVRVKRAGKGRWSRGHAIWVSDVFAYRGSSAMWDEQLDHVTDATLRDPSREEREKLHRLGDGFAVATFSTSNGETLDVAAGPDHRTALLGPFSTVTKPA